MQDNFESPAKDNEWFTLYIKVVGKRIFTQVNGKNISDYTEPDDIPADDPTVICLHETGCGEGRYR